MTDIPVSADVSGGQVALEAPALESDVVQTEAGAEDNQSGEDGEEGNTEETPFPKKAVNALNRAKREKRQLRAQVRELEAKLSELKAFKPDASTAPDPNKFETYTDFNEANVKHQIRAAMEEAQNKGKLEALESQRALIQEKRNQELNMVAVETAKQVPDLAPVISQYAPVLESLGSELTDVIYEMDNAPLAIYTLAKEGILEDVLSAPTPIATVHLMNAQARGGQTLSRRAAKPNVTAAPEPIRAAKGTGVNTKPLHALSGDDIMKWLKS